MELYKHVQLNMLENMLKTLYLYITVNVNPLSRACFYSSIIIINNVSNSYNFVLLVHRCFYNLLLVAISCGF